MNLDETQKKQVTAWINEGLKLADIQKRLDSELGIRMTYMEVRLLVDDLKVLPKDPEPPKPVEVGATSALAPAPGAPPSGALVSPTAPTASETDLEPGEGGVCVTVDRVARPGALVSGNVKFSDGNAADWSLDQMGRLGLAPRQKGYRPSAEDWQEFQMTLEAELSKAGL